MSLLLSPGPALSHALTRVGSATAAVAFVVASIATPLAIGLVLLRTVTHSSRALGDLTFGSTATLGGCAALFAVGLLSMALGLALTHGASRR